jgi:hypothetical protein
MECEISWRCNTHDSYEEYKENVGRKGHTVYMVR